MNFKRIGVTLVSLLLVACLLVNVSPIKANAAFLPPDPVLAPGPWDEVLWAVMIGLGIGFGATSVEEFAEDSETIKTWIKQNLDEGEIEKLFDADGMVQILSTSDPDLPYMVSEKLIEGARQYLVESEIITETAIEVTDGMCQYAGVELPALSDSFYEKYPYVAIVKGQTGSDCEGYYLIASPAPFYYRVNTLNAYPLDDFRNLSGATITSFSGKVSGDSWVGWSSGTWSVPNGSSLSGPLTYGVLWSNFDMYKCEFADAVVSPTSTLHIAGSLPVYPGTTTITVADGYESEYIAPLSQLLAEGYEPWHQKSYELTEDDGSTTTYYPISIGETFDDTLSVTQEDVWAGVAIGSSSGDGDDSSTVNPDVGTDSDSSTLSNIFNVLTSISEYQQSGTIATQTKIDGLADILDDSNDLIESLISANAFGFESVTNSIISLPGSIGDELTDIENLIGTLGGLIGGIDIDTDAMKGTLAGILAGVTAIPTEIAEAIAGVLTAAFVPSEGYIDAKVEALALEFPIVESIQATGDDLKDFMLNLGQQPPIIYIDLGAQRGFHNIGGRVAFIDLTWYAEYKPTMDAILSAFLWLWFAWRMFLSLPGILHGSSGLWHFSESHAGHTSAPIGSFNEKPLADKMLSEPRIHVPTESYNELLDYYEMDVFDNPEWIDVFGKRPSYSILKELYTVDLDDFDL